MSLPLYRQEKQFEQIGIELSRQNMSNWLMNLSKRYFIPVVEYMHKQLLKQQVI